MSGSTGQPSRQRVESLDGLRGIAALVVVIFHIIISDPAAGNIYRLDRVIPMSSLAYALNYSPLRVVWAGSEAVIVFYVLSGFVLALPFTRGKATEWRVFYPRRLVRLYLPAIASLILAWLSTLLVHRRVVDGASPWLNEHAAEPTGIMQIVWGSSLMAGWGGLNTSLWSLRWEVLFSLLLPLFLLLATRWRRLDLVKALTVVAFCALWPVFGIFYPDIVYISVFAIGVLMAFNLDRLMRLAQAIRTPLWVAIAIISVCLITNSWILAGFDLHNPLRLAWIAFASIGAAGFVFLAIGWPIVRSLLTRRWVTALGAISFSLYLTQEPVVVALAFLSNGRVPLWLELPIALGAALIVGALFHRCVERPSHRLARSLGANSGGAQTARRVVTIPTPDVASPDARSTYPSS